MKTMLNTSVSKGEKVLDIVPISANDTKKLQKFLDTAGNSLKTFRYFDKRPLSVLSNHFYTCLLMDGNRPIGYGHLDRDGGKIWLGIALIESECGKGHGRQIMEWLLREADASGIEIISLSVDSSNIPGRKLYEKYGFQLEREQEDKVFYNRHRNAFHRL